MSDDVQSGLEGVVAFATEIAEPDNEGGALRYRGVDIEELVGKVPFEQVWGLLVDGTLEPGLPPAEPHPLAVRSGDPRVDVQSALAMLGPEWGFEPLIDISDEEARDNLARASVMALLFVAQSARGAGRPPVPQREVDQGDLDPRALPHPLARRGRPRPRQGDRRLLDLGRRARHERLDVHRARDRLHRRRRRRGAERRGRRALRPAARRRARARAEDARRGRAGRRRRQVGQGRARPRRAPDGLRPPRLPRRGPARARCCAGPSKEIGSKRFEVAEALEKAALAELQGAQARPRARHQRRVLVGRRARPRRRPAATLFTSLFTCARTAGWSAHILEQKREARLIRPVGEVRRAGRAAPAVSDASSARWRMSRRAIASSSERPASGGGGTLMRRSTWSRTCLPSSVMTSVLTRRSCSAARRSTGPSPRAGRRSR